MELNVQQNQGTPTFKNSDIYLHLLKFKSFLNKVQHFCFHLNTCFWFRTNFEAIGSSGLIADVGGASNETPEEFFDARNAAWRAALLAAAAAAKWAALLLDDTDVFEAVVKWVTSSLIVRSSLWIVPPTVSSIADGDPCALVSSSFPPKPKKVFILIKNNFFLFFYIKWARPGSFAFIFVFSNDHYKFYNN